MLPFKILLFSADIPMSHNITNGLMKEGFKVIHITDGIGAMDLICTERPALIILDINLPGFSSLAIIRSVRAKEFLQRIPIILVGSMREEDVLIGLEVGADLCLTEEFHPQVFVARIRSLIRRSKPMIVS